MIPPGKRLTDGELRSLAAGEDDVCHPMLHHFATTAAEQAGDGDWTAIALEGNRVLGVMMDIVVEEGSFIDAVMTAATSVAAVNREDAILRTLSKALGIDKSKLQKMVTDAD